MTDIRRPISIMFMIFSSLSRVCGRGIPGAFDRPGREEEATPAFPTIMAVSSGSFIVRRSAAGFGRMPTASCDWLRVSVRATRDGNRFAIRVCGGCRRIRRASAEDWDKMRIVGKCGYNLWMFFACFGESPWITFGSNFPAGSQHRND